MGRFFLWVAAFFLSWVGSVAAEYTLVFKNGRRITVQSYREEDGMIKFHGLGGEIGIGKDQIQSILKAGEAEGRGMDLPRVESSPAIPTRGDQGAKSAETKEKVLSPEGQLAEKKAKERGEYQKRIKEITEQISSVKAGYNQASRGKDGPEQSPPKSTEVPGSSTEERSSRLKDALLLPDWAYTPKEQELSKMRSQIDQLEKERDKLIEEMKQKNLETGSLSSE